MRCPHCHFLFNELTRANPAQFILCNRCGRIWVDTGSQRPQGVLEAPLDPAEKPYELPGSELGSYRPRAALKAV